VTAPNRPSTGDVPDLRRGTLQGTTFKVLRFILLGMSRLLFRLRISGLENVPPSGPLLVVANHLHNADPLLISIAIPRPVHYMAKKELFAVPVLRRIIRLGGAFPVDRGTADRNAIRIADLNLKQGIAVGMFPEGTRSKSRALKTALPGAAAIAQLTEAPILPVAITGSERLFVKGVKIVVGKPFSIPSRTEDGQKIGRDEATNRLMTEIVNLLPPEYHGVYAGLAAPQTVASKRR
jgi:1-acyl-sn-glycerol-3-phosphate acyltransferase